MEALGGVGVGLGGGKEAPGTAEAVLQIYQQRFANPPSPLDNTVVCRLADMLIAGCVTFYYHLQ